MIHATANAAAAFGFFWKGPRQPQARSAYQRAREAGMSPFRAMVVAEVASWRDCWRFRTKIAKQIGCCVRTVQRALTEAQSLGLIRCHRGKKGEVPPGAERPVDCGWSHRYAIGVELAGRALREAIEKARARWLTGSLLRTLAGEASSSRAAHGAPSSRTTTERRALPASSTLPRRAFTAAEIDAELERMPRPPPDD